MKTFVLMAVLGVALSGCSGDGGNYDFADASGVVTFQGGPVAGALVTYIPEAGPVATARTDNDGKFTFTTGTTTGAVVGKGKVTVSLPSAEAASSGPAATDSSSAMQMMQQRMIPKPRGGRPVGPSDNKPGSALPQKYATVQTTPLTVTIEEGDNELKLELTN